MRFSFNFKPFDEFEFRLLITYKSGMICNLKNIINGRESYMKPDILYFSMMVLHILHSSIFFATCITTQLSGCYMLPLWFQKFWVLYFRRLSYANLQCFLTLHICNIFLMHQLFLKLYVVLFGARTQDVYL